MNNENVDIQLMSEGTSYIGEPKSHTIMYISRKVENLLESTRGGRQSYFY